MVQAPCQPKPQSLLLELPNTLVLHLSQEQFVALAAANRDLRLERTATGELIVNPPTGGMSGKRNLSITAQLGNWFEANENLGEAFDSSTGFKLPNGADRAPRCLLGATGTLGSPHPRGARRLYSPLSRFCRRITLQDRFADYAPGKNAGVYGQWHPVGLAD